MPTPRKGLSLNLRISYGALVGTKMVPPKHGLRLRGPSLEVQLGIHQHLAKSLGARGKPIPAPVPCTALIDTGATVTTIDLSIAKKLQLASLGDVTATGIGGLSHGFLAACCMNVHGLRINIARAHVQDFSGETDSITALIGRDVLQHFTLIYNGIEGWIELQLPAPMQSETQPHKPRKQRTRKPRKKKRR